MSDKTVSKTQEKKVAKTKVIKGYVLNEDGDLEMGLLEVPNDPDDKRRPYDPKIDRLSSAGMAQGSSNARSKHDKIVVEGVE